MPTVEEIDAELARRGTEPTLEEIDAELARRSVEPRHPPSASPSTPPQAPQQEMRALSPGSAALDAQQEIVRKLTSNVLRIGTPVAATMLGGRLRIPMEAAALLGSLGAGAGALGAQQVEQPGQLPNLKEAGMAAFMQSLGHLGAGYVGEGLMAASGVGPVARREVAERGLVGGTRLAFGKPVPEAELNVARSQLPKLQKQPLSLGRQQVEARLAQNAATPVPVAPLTNRLRRAVIKEVGQAAGQERSAAQARLSRLADRIELEVGKNAGVDVAALNPGARRAFMQGPSAVLPLTRFEELFRDEFVEPLQGTQSRISPRLQNPVYTKALDDVQDATRKDIARALGPQEGPEYLRELGRAKFELDAYDNFRESLFRNLKGRLVLQDGAQGKLQRLFTPSGATLRDILANFDSVTGDDTLSRLHELSLKRQLTSSDASAIFGIDEAIRGGLGSRYLRFGFLKSGARGIGKTLVIGAPIIGAALAKSRKEDSNLRIQGTTQ